MQIFYFNVFAWRKSLTFLFLSFLLHLHRILSITFYAIALFTLFSTSGTIADAATITTTTTTISTDVTDVISTSKNLPSLKCLMSYVNLHGIVIESSSPSTLSSSIFLKEDENKDEGNECASARQNLISDVRTGIRLKINEAEIGTRHQNCVYEMLVETETFVYSIIKAAVYEYKPRNESENLLNNTINDILGKIKYSAKLCEKYGNKFDNVFKYTKNLTASEEYCIKKYLVKNNFLDINMYEIDLNPYSINTTGLNCEEMIRKSNEDIYEQLSETYLIENPLNDVDDASRDTKVECAIEKFREADYFDLMLKITALTTLAITHEQKSFERESFIKAFSKISSNIVATC